MLCDQRAPIAVSVADHEQPSLRHRLGGFIRFHRDCFSQLVQFAAIYKTSLQLLDRREVETAVSQQRIQSAVQCRTGLAAHKTYIRGEEELRRHVEMAELCPLHFAELSDLSACQKQSLACISHCNAGQEVEAG